MEIESIKKELGKTLAGSEGLAKAGAEVLKDAEVLEGTEELSSPELIEKISEHLADEGRPGSSEYMKTFFVSSVLDAELDMFEAGDYEARGIEKIGLPAMIDGQQTTPEMIKEERAVLLPEAKNGLLGLINILEYKLSGHIENASKRASAHYAERLSKGDSVLERARAMLGLPVGSDEVPFLPNKVELERLRELSKLRYTSEDEAREVLQKELYVMMGQRPGLIGLETSASASRFLREVSGSLSERTEFSTDVSRLRNLHVYMKGHGMAELQIYPDYGDVIEERVERDFARLQDENMGEGTEGPEDVESGIEQPEIGWLAKDVNEKTARWFFGKGRGELVSRLSDTEQQLAEDFTREIIVEVNHRFERSGEGGSIAEAFKDIGKDEEEKEAMKLLLRVAVKVGTKATISMAKNLAKDKDTSKEMRVALGVFADLVGSGGRFADRLITGESRPDLERDCINFLKSKF